ncbi:hypothetical protein [Synechococcus sp. KORDI-100]|uniref:hypothetical protein n=1 Tax=Synechococcus sp. KORDI-100 TaxID=1280380 RepID=UPI0012E01EA8|nr:hypothetical protein [Synechococcus sp. KORDI-100]
MQQRWFPDIAPSLCDERIQTLTRRLVQEKDLLMFDPLKTLTMNAASRTQHLWAKDFLKNKEKWKVPAWRPGDSSFCWLTL